MRFIKTVINYEWCAWERRRENKRAREKESGMTRRFTALSYTVMDIALIFYALKSILFALRHSIRLSASSVCLFIHSFARFDRIFRFLHKTTKKTQENIMARMKRKKKQKRIFLPFNSSVFFFFLNCHSITNIYNKSNVENLMCTLEVWSVLARWVLEWWWFDWKYRWMCKSLTVPLHR